MRIKTLLIATFLGFQVLDVITTNLSANVPNAFEANPVMAWAQSSLGDYWWVTKFYALIAAYAFHLLPTVWLVILMDTIFGVVVVGNIHVLIH